MKKIRNRIFIYILTIATCVSFIHTDTKADNTTLSWPSQPGVYAESAVLIESSTGTVLYDKKCNKKMYPASITKIMTALLAIENCSLDETVVFSEHAINSLSYDDANIACQIGEKMSVKECLYALMLSSANEVATALGEHIAGSIDKFSDMMNERAKQAGAKNTHFANANGLHDTNHYITAYDMAMITRAAAQYPLFNEIVNSTTYTISKNNKRKESFASYQRHKMVWPTSGFYYDGIIGGKTGFTDQSGTTLVTYAKRNGMTLIAVTLNSNGNNVYNDTKILLDYGFNNFNLVNISENDKRFSETSLSSLKSPFCDSTDSICLDNTSNVVVPKNTDLSKLAASVNFSSSEDSFAKITYNYGDKSVGSARIKYISSVSNKNPETAVKKKSPQDNNSVKASADKQTPLSKDKKSIKNIITTLVPILIVIAVVILLFILITLQRRRLNRIRAIKRHRNR